MVNERRKPPGTEEGWYALHDLRRIDWDAWRDATERERDRAVEDGVSYLRSHVELEDADAGGSSVFSIVGHKADLLVLHLRPTLEELDRVERRFETTALSEFTERADSYVSVTEVSGYMHEDLSEGFDAVEDEGMKRYMQQRIYPTIPDATHVCFYPMDKRRDPEYNWYDLPFEERAEHMSSHGDIGRTYAGKVTQIITGSVGLDDHEWGVTLFADDPTEIKHLLYEMRFDPSTSRFAEFGTFYVGQQFPPEDLRPLLEGETVPTGGGDSSTADRQSSDQRTGGRPSVDEASYEEITAEAFADRAAGVDLESHPDAGYGIAVRSTASIDELREATAELRDGFDRYDTHVGTTVTGADGDAAVVSLWANERAANTAAGFLADLPGATDGVGASLGDADGDEPTESRPPADDGNCEEITAEEFRQRVSRFGIDLEEHADAGYGLLFRSSIDAETLVDEVEGLRLNFDHYDTHVLTTVRADGGETAVVSLWANERAANTAAGFLADLSGTGGGVGAALAGSSTADERAAHGTDDDETLRAELSDLDIYAGKPHGEDVYALVLYSETDPETLFDELSTLRERFDHYDSHVKSAIYSAESGGRSAIVSLWESREAAETAGEYLHELPGIVARAGEESGFGTMGMFYTVEPQHRESFVETFDEVGELLGEMEGHLESQLLVNEEDENDMFIASQWRAKDDAVAFFRSDAFRDTVQWGREVLADRPRHVFLS